MEIFTIKRMIWKWSGPCLKDQKDYKGQIRYVLFDGDGVSWNHYDSEEEASYDVPLYADWVFVDCVE